MHLAVLITNTDDSAFARARPDDGAKFASMINAVRPDWRCAPIWVSRGAPLQGLERFDGLMVTGSPASTLSNLPWIAALEAALLAAMARGQPLFGACFGHQLIAKALGAPIIANPDGWGHGLLTLRRTARAPWSGLQDELALYGSHAEQVGALPRGAETLFEGPGLPVAGYRIGPRVFTVQHHPEMDHGFITDLVEEYATALGPAVTRAARASLTRRADSTAFATEIARFFETATAPDA